MTNEPRFSAFRGPCGPPSCFLQASEAIQRASREIKVISLRHKMSIKQQPALGSSPGAAEMNLPEEDEVGRELFSTAVAERWRAARSPLRCLIFFHGNLKSVYIIKNT